MFIKNIKEKYLYYFILEKCPIYKKINHFESHCVEEIIAKPTPVVNR